MNLMIPVFLELLETDGPIRQTFTGYNERNWSDSDVTDDMKKEVAFDLLKRIDKIGKGEFAQRLAMKLSCPTEQFAVPDYIKKAVLWACGRS